MANISPSPQVVMGHVHKLGDTDPDFRFMALTDLISVLGVAKRDFLSHDYNISARTIDSVIKALDDQNGEVQNLAVKCLGPLVDKIPHSLICPMVDKLANLKLKNSVDDAIPSLALRSVIIALPHPVTGLASYVSTEESVRAISQVLIPRLVGPALQTRAGQSNLSLPQGMLKADNITADTVDVLIEVVRCFGPALEEVEVEALLEVTLQLLDSDKGSSAVKKRSVIAISMLAVYLSDAHLAAITKRLTDHLAKPDSLSPVTRRLYIAVFGSLARSIPARFEPHVASAMPRVLQALSEEELEHHVEQLNEGDDLGQDFNQVCEAALVTLDAFLVSCPQQMRDWMSDAITTYLRFLKYDPNVSNDDDEDMDEDDDEEMDEEDDFDDDDGFDDDDDDDASWKVRRCAAKGLYVLIGTQASNELLENGILYSRIAPQLVKRIDEREETVRLEVVSALSLLVRKTSQNVPLTSPGLDDFEDEFVAQVPTSRKRRRQSSDVASSQPVRANGTASPVVRKNPSSGPQADLARLTPAIIKAAVKQLNGKLIASKQAVINLVDDVVCVQDGGLADFFADIITPVIDAIRTAGGSHGSTTGPSGSVSATSNTLSVAALKLVSDVSRTHSSTLLQPYLSKIVDGVIFAVHDRFYKVSGAAVRAVEELIKAITPPRSRNVGTQFQGDLDKLYEVLIERNRATDVDSEVRQKAIHGLGVLVARTSSPEGAVLLSIEKRAAVLHVLKERLQNETTRIAAVRAIDHIVAHANTPGLLEDSWVREVAAELSGQLRKADRTLRGSSISALKHLTSSEAAKGKLDPSTTKTIVSAITPAITQSDAHLLGPALLILSDLARENQELVLSDGIISALCTLLQTHFATVVLDQLLSLFSNIGPGTGVERLMKGILIGVGCLGDSTTVGRSMGALLVGSRGTAGVSLDTFVEELHRSTTVDDTTRVCLANAVLGEAGMRMGASSPLDPDLFLSQFRPEPDKVSLSAATALGSVGSGNAAKYMPVILENMQQGGNTQYLLILSIKEVLRCVSPQSTDLRKYAQPIWDQLLEAAKHADNRVVCAECVGRLVVLDPPTFMPKLQLLLKDISPGVRGMAVQAVRYTLPESDDVLDNLLGNVLIDMLLTMLQDADMETRRLAMTTLNSAAHNKPDLIVPHLGELMPLVMRESHIKPELITEVQLGPFKHTVDGGLEVRKGAYDTLYALMATAVTRISSREFYDRVIAGLGDDNDIRQLCNLMVTKLIVIAPDETARRLNHIAEAYRAVLSVKLKDNAVKQDHEKQDEANKSVLRVTILLGEKMKDMTGNAGAATTNVGATSVWTAYWDWVTKEFEKQLRTLKTENQVLHASVA